MVLQAIECMGFDTINKVFLVYDSVWWGDDLQGIQLIWDCIEKSDPDHQVTIDTCLSFNLNNYKNWNSMHIFILLLKVG